MVKVQKTPDISSIVASLLDISGRLAVKGLLQANAGSTDCLNQVHAYLA